MEAKHYQQVTCLCTGTILPHSPKPEFITCHSEYLSDGRHRRVAVVSHLFPAVIKTQVTDAQESILAGEGANPEAVPLVPLPVLQQSGLLIRGMAHGNQNARLRVTLAELFCRPHWQTYELYRETVTQEILDRNSDRFATLMGMDTMNGWNDNQTIGIKNGATEIDPDMHRRQFKQAIPNGLLSSWPI